MRPQAIGSYDAIHLAALAKRYAGHEAYDRAARLNAAQVARELEDFAFSEATNLEVNRDQLAALWPLIGNTVAADLGMEPAAHGALAGRIAAMHRAMNGPAASAPVMPPPSDPPREIPVTTGESRMATALPWALLAGGAGAGAGAAITSRMEEDDPERFTGSDRLAVAAAALGSAAAAGTIAGRPRQVGTVMVTG